MPRAFSAEIHLDFTSPLESMRGGSMSICYLDTTLSLHKRKDMLGVCACKCVCVLLGPHIYYCIFILSAKIIILPKWGRFTEPQNYWRVTMRFEWGLVLGSGSQLGWLGLGSGVGNTLYLQRSSQRCVCVGERVKHILHFKDLSASIPQFLG